MLRHLQETLRLKAKPDTREMWALKARFLYEQHSLRAVPTQLGLCLTHLCGLKHACAYCMRQTFVPPEGPMTLGHVKLLLSRMPSITGVCIMGLCEPYMNPESSDIIRWLKLKGGYAVTLTTNGTITLDNDKLDALRCVEVACISIDTADPETFRRLRGGADLGDVMMNLRRLIDFKHLHGLGVHDSPSIKVNAVITELNFRQIPELIKMLEPYAKDIAHLMIDPVSRPDYSKFKSIMGNEGLEALGPSFQKIAATSPLNVTSCLLEPPVKTIGFNWMFKESFGWSRCHMPWYGMFVQPNGDIYFCYNYRYVLGNAFQEDPLEAWNNSRAQDFRRQLLTDDPPLRQCHSCNFARTEWQEGGIYHQKEDARR